MSDNDSSQQHPIPPVVPISLAVNAAISAFQNIAEEATKAAAALRGLLPIYPQPPIDPLPIRPPIIAAAVSSVSDSAPEPSSALASESAGLIAVSGAIGKRFASDSTLQSLVQDLASNAIAGQAKSMSVLPFMMQQGNPVSTTGVSAGSGGNGGLSGKPLPSNIPPPVVSYFWWGFQIKLTHEAVAWYVAGENITAGAAGAAGAIYPITDAAMALVAAGGSVGPGVVFFAALALYLVAEAALVQAADKGKGVILSMSWVAPGIFVPTSA